MTNNKPLALSERIADRVSTYYEVAHGVYESDDVSERKIERLIDAEVRPLVEALEKLVLSFGIVGIEVFNEHIDKAIAALKHAKGE